jgi:DNA-binding MarR family transcriptional regulator
MAAQRPSQLQKHILLWLAVETRRTRGILSPSYTELVQELVAYGTSKSNASRSVKNLEAKGLVSVGRTAGGQAEYLNLTTEGQQYALYLVNTFAKNEVR